MPIKPGTKVLPYDPEDDRQPPPPPGTGAANKKTRVAVSNLTVRQWSRLDNDDAKALEIVWVKPNSTAAKLAKQHGRLLNSSQANICLNKYLKKWHRKAPSCELPPKFGGPVLNPEDKHADTTPQPAPDRQVRLVDQSSITFKTTLTLPLGVKRQASKLPLNGNTTLFALTPS